MGPSKGSEGASVPGLSPWVIDGRLHLHMVFSLDCASYKFPVLGGTSHNGLGFILVSLTGSPLYKPCLPVRSHSVVLGVAVQHMNLDGSTIQPIIATNYVFPFLPTLGVRFSPLSRLRLTGPETKWYPALSHTPFFRHTDAHAF